MKKTTIFLLTAIAAASAVFFLSRCHKPEDSPEEVFVAASTVGERMDYFACHGWDVEEISEKSIIIPSVFSDEYEEYARIQDRQGLPLRKYMGRNAVLYVFGVKNYSPDSKKMLAELIVCDDIAVSSMVYSDDGGSIRMPVQ